MRLFKFLFLILIFVCLFPLSIQGGELGSFGEFGMEYDIENDSLTTGLMIGIFYHFKHFKHGLFFREDIVLNVDLRDMTILKREFGYKMNILENIDFTIKKSINTDFVNSSETETSVSIKLIW